MVTRLSAKYPRRPSLLWRRFVDGERSKTCAGFGRGDGVGCCGYEGDYVGRYCVYLVSCTLTEKLITQRRINNDNNSTCLETVAYGNRAVNTARQKRHLL